MPTVKIAVSELRRVANALFDALEESGQGQIELTQALRQPCMAPFERAHHGINRARRQCVARVRWSRRPVTRVDRQCSGVAREAAKHGVKASNDGAAEEVTFTVQLVNRQRGARAGDDTWRQPAMPCGHHRRPAVGAKTGRIIVAIAHAAGLCTGGHPLHR